MGCNERHLEKGKGDSLAVGDEEGRYKMIG